MYFLSGTYIPFFAVKSDKAVFKEGQLTAIYLTKMAFSVSKVLFNLLFRIKFSPLF